MSCGIFANWLAQSLNPSLAYVPTLNKVCAVRVFVKPGFHIVVSVVSVVRKKFIGQTDTTFWKPPIQLLNTTETTDTTCCTK